MPYTGGVWAHAQGSRLGCPFKTSKRVKGTGLFLDFCLGFKLGRCIFNCSIRMSFGCLAAVRLLFQVDYNQNASKSTNSWEKQVAVLTLGLLIRLWNAGGC
jgi:hypothetical protein